MFANKFKNDAISKSVLDVLESTVVPEQIDESIPSGYQNRDGRLIPKINKKMSAHDHGYDYTHQSIEDAPSKSSIHSQHKEIMNDNPHPKGSKEHSDWLAGTHKAKADVLKMWEEVQVDESTVVPEQIDELKKSTLASYAKKASSSSDERSASNLSSRAAVKLAQSFEDGKDDGEKEDKKSFQRSKGIGRAIDRLTKEEVEQVDESIDLPFGYKMKMKHSEKYRIHDPKGLHIGDTTQEPDGKWRYHTGKSSKWDGTENHPDYITGRVGSKKAAGITIASTHHDIKEEVEQVDEIFHKVPNTKAAWDYMDKKREVRNAEHEKQDPKMAKHYAKNMVDTAKAAKKAKERGIKKDVNDFGWQVRNGVQRGKLPEEVELDEAQEIHGVYKGPGNTMAFHNKNYKEPGVKHEILWHDGNKVTHTSKHDSAEDVHKTLTDNKYVKESKDTETKDASGKVTSWSHEGDWKKSSGKQGQGKVNHLSDLARRKTAKLATKEVGELDELSKKTLGSYVKAASKDAEESGRNQEYYGDQSDYDRGAKRQKGISKAVDKLTKEEIEPIEELSKTTLKSYRDKATKHMVDKKAELGMRMGTKADWKRIRGIENSSSKIGSKNESVEPLDEREESPTKGTRKVASYGDDGHRAEVRYNPEYQEYQVHHYKDGKHQGEGPVSYHGDDKEDAHDTAKYSVSVK